MRGYLTSVNSRRTVTVRRSPISSRHHRYSRSFIEQMDVESVLEQMTNEVRTAGLRKGRENALVELVAEVRAR